MGNFPAERRNSMKHKKLLVILIIAAVVLILAALLFFKPFAKKTVNVYPVSELATEDYYEYESDLSGVIREEGFQNIYISDTQTVSDIYVEMGQQVQPGDALLSYDTTLTDLELEKAELEVQKLKLELQKAQQDLAEINALIPSSEVLVEPDNSWIHYEPVKTPYFLSGTGTKKDPIYYIIDSEDEFDSDFFKNLIPKGKKKTYLVFLIRENNAVNGKIEESFGFEVSYKKDEISFKPFVPDIPDEISDYDEPEEPYYERRGSDYSAGEISSMRMEKEADIRELTTEVKLAELEYEKKTKEITDNVVRAKTEGTVKMVRDPETALSKELPLIRISSGGGYYVDVLLNELSLDTIKAGDTVNVSSYESGTSCTGEVTRVSDMPSENTSGWYSDMNTNVSYYPVTIFISEDENLREGEYVNISTSSEDREENSFYLEDMFLLRDKGHTYVYVDNDGTLEKREVVIGKNLYGYATQIKEGLSKEDAIAFPYGKKVKDGAPTNLSDSSELYE